MLKYYEAERTLFLLREAITLETLIAYVKARFPYLQSLDLVNENHIEHWYNDFVNQTRIYNKIKDEAFVTLENFDGFLLAYEKMVRTAIGTCFYFDRWYLGKDLTLMLEASNKKLEKDWSLLYDIYNVLEESLFNLEASDHIKPNFDASLVFKILKKHSKVFSSCLPFIIFSKKLLSVDSLVKIFHWSDKTKNTVLARKVLLSVLRNYMEALKPEAAFPWWCTPDSLYQEFLEKTLADRQGLTTLTAVSVSENANFRYSFLIANALKIDEGSLFNILNTKD